MSSQVSVGIVKNPSLVNNGLNEREINVYLPNIKMGW